MNKYTYYKVIQSNFGYGWDDESHYEVNASYNFKSKEDAELYRADIKEYRVYCNNIRVIHRRELNN